MPKPPHRELDPIRTAAMARLFDRTGGNIALVAQEFGVDISQVFAAVLADTRRSVAPKDPAPARLFIVPRQENAA